MATFAPPPARSPTPVLLGTAASFDAALTSFLLRLLLLLLVSAPVLVCGQDNDYKKGLEADRRRAEAQEEERRAKVSVRGADRCSCTVARP